MGAETPKEQTALERSMMRNGGCGAVACTTQPCEEFAYTGLVDGFRMCVCGHTQHIHEFGGTA